MWRAVAGLGGRLRARMFWVALLEFLASLVPLSRELLAALKGRETSWWRPPAGTSDELLADLRPASRQQYRGVLADLYRWVDANHRQIVTLRDLDDAVYRYIPTISRHTARTLIAALHKVYPPTRGNLPWALARVKAVSAEVPVVHHKAMPWLLMLGLARVRALAGRPFRALLLLITWKFGLRPGEAVGLHGRDIYVANSSRYLGALLFLRLGARSGTKLRRPQLARARREDPMACWLLSLAARVTPYDARISDIHSYPAFASEFP